MNKDKYSQAMNGLKSSEDFNIRTARLMREARQGREGSTMNIKKTAFAFAGAAVIITAGAFAITNSNLLQTGNNISDNSGSSITVPQVNLPNASTGVTARMIPLFVYQGKIYLRYNTAIATTDGYTVSEEDMLSLRGDYLGTTKSGINEFSGKEDYTEDFASNIGESEVYTVKGYDSKYRLMVYTKYEGGFGCEIYDSFGGLSLKNGADYFGLLNLKDNVASYEWENLDSWNNGGSGKTQATAEDIFNDFLDKLYDATPVEGSVDWLIENTESDSQKFLYLQTKDHLVTTLRLLKDGYVYAPEVGFFQVDKEAFDAFYASLQ